MWEIYLRLIYLNMYIFGAHWPNYVSFTNNFWKLVCIHHLAFNKFPASLPYSLCVGIIILENILPAISSNFESFLANNSQLNKPGFKMYEIILEKYFTCRFK